MLSIIKILKNIYFIFYFISDQINAVLVNIRDFFEKHLK